MANLIGDIVYSRGDSYAIVLWLKDKNTGEFIDITGYTFLLTVDPDKAPEDDTHNVFQLVGLVDPDQETNKGKFSFKPTEEQSNSVGKLYYDIQFVDPDGNKRTFVKGFKFTLDQDITKE